MQKRSPRILLAALAAGTTAFAVFRVLAAPPVTESSSQSTQSTKDASAQVVPAQPAPILLAQAATPPQIGAVGGGTAGAGSDIAPEHADWKMVWEDDFSKETNIDPKKWSHVVGGGGFGNNEAEYYTDDPKNSSITDKMLTMNALREDMGGEHYTSAKLWTKGLYSFEYGRAEACIKAPSAQAGNWPAFWLMPDEPSPYGGWPGCGEIDILEMVNDAKTCYGTIHYGKTWRDKIGSQATSPDFSTDFHVYGIEWEKDQFRFYLDHKPYGKVDGKDASGKPTWYTPNHDYPAPFNQKFYIILNFALGGDWPNNVINPKRKLPDADGKFPQTMLVKWVRVYQP